MLSKEQHACDIIMNLIDNVLPIGGMSLYIGTPTPLCVAPKTHKSNQIICDNLLIADRLNRTSEKMIIEIGSAVNENKAFKKAELWERVQYLNDVVIKVGPVIGSTFRNEVERLAKRYKLVKVILMTSGSWTGTGNKYNLDLNFKDPSIELCSQYPNLHIVAMVTGYLTMKVLYIHNKRIEIIKEHGKYLKGG
jgi:hypothetical protein